MYRYYLKILSSRDSFLYILYNLDIFILGFEKLNHRLNSYLTLVSKVFVRVLAIPHKKLFSTTTSPRAAGEICQFFMYRYFLIT